MAGVKGRQDQLARQAEENRLSRTKKTESLARKEKVIFHHGGKGKESWEEVDALRWHIPKDPSTPRGSSGARKQFGTEERFHERHSGAHLREIVMGRSSGSKKMLLRGAQETD